MSFTDIQHKKKFLLVCYTLHHHNLYNINSIIGFYLYDKLQVIKS